MCTVSRASLAELQSWSQATPAWIRATLSSPPPVSHLHGNPAACFQTSFQKFPLFSFLLPVVHSGSPLLFLDPHPVFQSDLSHPAPQTKAPPDPTATRRKSSECLFVLWEHGTLVHVEFLRLCVTCTLGPHFLVDQIIAFWPPPATWLTVRNVSLFISPVIASLWTPTDVTLHTRASDPVMHHLLVPPAAELQLRLTHNLCPSAQVRCRGHKSHWLFKTHA